MQNFIANIVVGSIIGALVAAVLDWWNFPEPYPVCIAFGAIFGLIAGLPAPIILRWTLAGAPIGFIVGAFVSAQEPLFPEGFSTAGYWISCIVGMIVCGIAAAVAGEK